MDVSLGMFITLSLAAAISSSRCVFAQSLAFLNALAASRNLSAASVIAKDLS